MVSIDIKPNESSPKWPPQIVLLLDDGARVLNVNRGLAGTSFSSISETDKQHLHVQIHPNCDGKCRFEKLWNKAWITLDTRENIEWEVDDLQLGRLLRLNLSKPPTSRTVEQDRRSRHALLTITDITKYRREYESLIAREQALAKLLLKQGMSLDDSDNTGHDEAGDTGNRLMAGYMKKDRSFSRQVVRAQENERKRIASELHDGIAQALGVVKYGIEASVARLAEQNPNLDVSMFDGAIEQIRGVVDEVRRISSNLSPSMLEDFGVGVALECLCKEFRFQYPELHIHREINIDEGETPDLVKIAIYRLVQEALNNACKHASATRVDVSLDATGEGVKLMISDNGAGFDLLNVQRNSTGLSGLGLRNMRERVEATGGIFDLKAAHGQGVVICAEWTNEELLDLIA